MQKHATLEYAGQLYGEVDECATRVLLEVELEVFGVIAFGNGSINHLSQCCAGNNSKQQSTRPW